MASIGGCPPMQCVDLGRPTRRRRDVDNRDARTERVRGCSEPYCITNVFGRPGVRLLAEPWSARRAIAQPRLLSYSSFAHREYRTPGVPEVGSNWTDHSSDRAGSELPTIAS
jgi:hypothetical protein